MKTYHLSVVVATGLVGQEIVRLLQSRRFPAESISLYSSDRSVGRRVAVNQRELVISQTSPEAFRDRDLVFFAAGAEVARYWVPLAVQYGAVVIDASEAFRAEPDVPLVVPEVNPQDILNHKGVIANPNCSTIQLALLLHPLDKVNPIKNVVVCTYQSVSGYGVAAVDELARQTRMVLDGQTPAPHVFPHQIAFNVLPEVDVFMDNGYTREEWKLSEETRRVLHANNMIISATCARVPVNVGHCQAIHIEFVSSINTDDARRILSGAPGVRVTDDPSVSLYPQPWSVAGTNDVTVGRIRQDTRTPTSLALWAVADNLRKGTALNAIQIAEEGLKRGVI
ncbi:MAG: aspartate-semialdehyde dehydrogenase [Chloroflexi bacterium]|nr:aspartate-semialdehyde dehydrogenase [Chloroflexota bacterium]